MLRTLGLPNVTYVLIKTRNSNKKKTGKLVKTLVKIFSTEQMKSS